MKVVSLFAGCGGLDLGFTQAGYNVTWANEIMPDAAESYTRNLGHAPVVDDIWKIIDKVPKADIVIGGPPCQAFSLVGKRMENDPRAKLVFAYQTVIKNLLPRAFVMENVPGLMASKIDGERLVDYLAREYEKMGYSVSLNHLTASDYFVPQRRKRVVMIGIRNPKQPFAMISAAKFASLIGMKASDLPVTAEEALSDLPVAGPKGVYDALPYGKNAVSRYSKLMRAKKGKSVTHQAMPTMSKLDLEFVKHCCRRK